MKARELTQWMAYSRIEPFGTQREDYHHARTAAMVANASRKSRSCKVFAPSDFIHKRRKTEKQNIRAFAQMLDTLAGQKVDVVKKVVKTGSVARAPDGQIHEGDGALGEEGADVGETL